MAYDPSNLSALTYANGFTLWHYKTPDPAGDVVQRGYFNESASMFRVGDFIITNANIGKAAQSGLLVVDSNADGEVGMTPLGNFVA